MVSHIQKNFPRKTLKFWRSKSPRHFHGREWNQNDSCTFYDPLEEPHLDLWFDPRNNGVNKEARLVNGMIKEANSSRQIGQSSCFSLSTPTTLFASMLTTFPPAGTTRRLNSLAAEQRIPNTALATSHAISPNGGIYVNFSQKLVLKFYMFHVIHLIHRELSKASLSLSLSSTKKLHALVLSTNLSQDPFYATQIVRLYGFHGQLCNARKVFEESPKRSVFLWNAVIRACAQAHKFSVALSLFTMMLMTDIEPDNFTYACLVRASSEMFDVHGLKLFHAKALVSGLGRNSICGSALVKAYSKLCLDDEAIKVFLGITKPDLVMWNTMVSAYGNCGDWDKSLGLFNMMRMMGKKPDGYTLVGLLSGLTNSSLVYIGQGIHGFCLKSGFDSSSHVASALVSMYSKCKSMNSVHKVFGEIARPDLVTWSSLITGCAQSGENKNALFYFKEMTFSGSKPDFVLTASVLALASQMANVKHGIEIHAYVLRHGLETDVKVCSSLIDMYSKSGFLALGIRVFEIMPKRNIVTYNALILGFGLHGLACKAFEKFEEIMDNGLVPDESTFSALLCACCHSGLVEEGRDIFGRMREFSVRARTEHYVHLVKLLGMNGRLEEAYHLIQSLPLPVDHGIWGALLSCCDACGDFKLAETVAQRLIENNPKRGSYRVMLSNIYACDGRWDDSMKLRDAILKTPGASWIDSNSGYPFITSNVA